jgi:hypothetical protein
MRFGTEWYQSVVFGTSTQYDSLYGLLIGDHKIILRGKTMLEHLPGREIVASVVGDATSMNLEEAIDRRVKETQQHEC